MSTIAFVPARAGSISIKNKNIKPFCSKPLIYWSLKALQECTKIDQIYLSTDGGQIAEVAKSFNFPKLSIYMRDPENATSTASTESAMLEFIGKANLNKEDIFVLVQATSPFTKSEDFQDAVMSFRKLNAESMLSVVRQKRFYWNADGDSLNYDYKNRPRRQNFDGMFMENGAFYISSVANILKYKNRLSGKIIPYEMPEYTGLELDEELDWFIGETLMKKYNLKSKVLSSENIKLFLSDVDGVLTDAGMYYAEKGDELKKFSTYDGIGFKLIQEKGIKVGILTSENCELNKRRAAKLKLDYDFHEILNKKEFVEKLIAKLNISFRDVAYVGDEINDLELLSSVGLAFCPANAHREVKKIKDIILLKNKGGEGVIREIYDNYFSS